MTVQDLVATLRQGKPITARLVREIVAALERLLWVENRLPRALASCATARRDGDITLSGEESGWICADLDAHARLREAVSWLLHVETARDWVMVECPWTTDDSWGEVVESCIAARAEVARLVAS